MCARCLKEGMFLPGKKRAARNKTIVQSDVSEVPIHVAVNDVTAFIGEKTPIASAAATPPVGAGKYSVPVSPLFVINMTLSVASLIVCYFKEFDGKLG